MFKMSVSPGNDSFDPHTEPHYDVTVGQLTFFIVWLASLALYLLKVQQTTNNVGNSNQQHEGNHKTSDYKPHVEELSEDKHQMEDFEAKQRLVSEGDIRVKHNEVKVQLDNEVIPKGNGVTSGAKGNRSTDNGTANTPTAIAPPKYEEFIRSVVVFGAIMIFFYLCDYRKIFPKMERVYDRDTFLFLIFLLFLVAAVFTIKPTKDKILNRDQTEEWKGWMQVLFVWYHVFAAKEWYNWIRVYIAAYVWMTGFGNFSFFWVRKDYSLWRFLKMQFRLNFLVTCICVVTSNQYMLYYICAMHSYWFISVYVFMGTLSSWNTDSKKMAIKFLFYFVFNFLIFDVSVVRENIFRPFTFFLKYTDPRFDPMHEWTFRAGLDHWACFVGMLCAYNYPHYESFMKSMESPDSPMKLKRRIAVRLSLVIGAVLTLCVWYKTCMLYGKIQYNAQHPYTSWIPIVAFIVIRNSFPTLRNYYISLFAWLGKITLETYLSQLHIYLQSNAKDLIGYLNPQYKLLNFALATIIYLPISYSLFNLTTIFSAYLLPKDLKLIVKNVVICACVFGIPYIALTVLLWVG